MVTLADFSDTASMVNCGRCGQLLQEGDRFCRFCGQEQEVSPDAELITLTDAPESFGMQQPLASAPAAARWSGRGPPAADGTGTAAVRPRGRSVSISARWVLGIAVVVLLVLAAALLHDLYRSEQDESTRHAELGSALAQVEAALQRGDLNEVQLKLAILDALNPNDADVKAQREAFDRRVQELTAERDRLRESMAKGQAAPPVQEPRRPVAAEAQAAAAAAAAAPTPAPAPPAPAPVVAAPTPAPVAVPVTAPPEPAPSAASANSTAPSPPVASGPLTPAASPPASPPATAPARAASSSNCPEAMAALSLCPSR